MRCLSLAFLLCFGLLCEGQKYDYLWLLGANLSSGDTTNPLFSITQFDFNTPQPLLYRVYRPCDMWVSSSSIADKNGALEFATNAFNIYNRNNQQMPNGDSLNPGQIADDYFGAALGYPSCHGSMIIPAPENDSLYYIFHAAWKYSQMPPYAYCDKLYTTKIDTRLDNGLGDITEKNKLITEGVFVGGGGMAACKHANGRDWWIVMQEMQTTCFYVYLLTPKGIDTIGKQCLGDTVHYAVDRGSNLFTPNGDRYIWSNPFENLNILEFDRCTGTFSNYVRIRASDSLLRNNGTAMLDGVAVSSNSRYLYLATGTELRQFDLMADSIELSEIIIDNTLKGSPQTTTLYCQLAPDGKIYINTFSSDTFLHVVNYPDSGGVACNFVRNAIDLPTYNNQYLPYYPNYRLGRLTGSACDTVYSDVKPIYTQTPWLKVFPNPATSDVQFDYNWIEWEKMEDLKLKIEDLQGRVVLEREVPRYSTRQNFSVKELAAGVYTVSLCSSFPMSERGNVIAVCKLTKVQ